MEKISAFRRQLETHRPADWETLPDFPLYMDQVLSYMERQTIRLDESGALTASMVNNYTKNALVPRAEGKKYNRDHLAYLTFVCILKQVMSVRDMDLLIRTELSDDRSVENGYRAFLESLDGALSSTVQEMGAYEGTDNLADAAVHFGLLSYAAGLVSRQYVAHLRTALQGFKDAHAGKYGTLLMTLENLKDADWENNWKQYYKPMEIGERLLVIPEWEQENVKGQAKYAGKVPLILEPGLTFGTGSHATTRLCLTALEEAVHGGETVLDLGCGSGILSIAALRLGAASAKDLDIDDKCQTVPNENSAHNGIGKDRYAVLVGDVLSNGALRETLGGGYDVVVANIVADVIIGLAPMVRQFLKPGGLFLCSGIIDTRAGEVADALRQNGWEIETTRSGEGWYSYACR